MRNKEYLQIADIPADTSVCPAESTRIETSGETSNTAGQIQLAADITLMEQGHPHALISMEEFGNLLSGIPVAEIEPKRRNGMKTPRKL